MTTLTLEDPQLRSQSPAEVQDPEMLHIPPEAHSYSGFLDWVMSDDFPEKQRVTFINGQVYLDMSEEA